MADALLELHADIDTAYDQRRQELEQELSQLDNERRAKHEALDMLWPTIRHRYLVGPTPPPVPPVTPAETANGKRTFFPLQDTLHKLVSDMPEGTETNQQVLIALLLKQYPQLASHKKDSLRSQVAQLLKKFARPGGMLELAKESLGGNPAIYRKIKQDEEKNEPAVSAAGSLLPASEHKEDLPAR